jgi:ribosome-binding factor A
VLGSDVEKRSTLEGLQSAAAHLRSRLGRALRLRFAPELAFHADASVAHAARIETLLEQIRDGRVPADEEPLD